MASSVGVGVVTTAQASTPLSRVTATGGATRTAGGAVAINGTAERDEMPSRVTVTPHSRTCRSALAERCPQHSVRWIRLPPWAFKEYGRCQQGAVGQSETNPIVRKAIAGIGKPQ